MHISTYIVALTLSLTDRHTHTHTNSQSLCVSQKHTLTHIQTAVVRESERISVLLSLRQSRKIRVITTILSSLEKHMKQVAQAPAIIFNLLT